MTKAKRGRPPGSRNKSKSASNLDDEVISQTPNEPESSTDEEQLEDPSLFEDVNQERIPKLENRAKKLAQAQKAAKTAKEIEGGLEEECLLIMADYSIETYNKHGVHLRIDRKPKLKVTID